MYCFELIIQDYTKYMNVVDGQIHVFFMITPLDGQMVVDRCTIGDEQIFFSWLLGYNANPIVKSGSKCFLGYMHFPLIFQYLRLVQIVVPALNR